MSNATSGPRSKAPMIPSTSRDPNRSGVKTVAAMMMAGRFSVDELCAMAIVASTPAPFRRKADEMGTIHAEQSVIGVPTINP